MHLPVLTAECWLEKWRQEETGSHLTGNSGPRLMSSGVGLSSCKEALNRAHLQHLSASHFMGRDQQAGQCQPVPAETTQPRMKNLQRSFFLLSLLMALKGLEENMMQKRKFILKSDFSIFQVETYERILSGKTGCPASLA